MNKKKLNVLSFVNYVFFILLTLIMIYPFWYVLMYSLSDPGKVSINNYYLIPDGFSLVTYKHVLRQPFLLLGYKNTAFVTATGTIISLFMTVITAYPLSREKLTGKKIYFRLILFTMLFSGGMIPTYLVIRGIGLLDTLWALIIPNAVSVYYMLIMIKFFKGIPVSLIESARIDGYDDIAILFKIVLPLSTAVLASIGLFYAVGRWNEYLPGVLYINDRNKRVLQVVLRTMLDEGTSGVPYESASGDILTPETTKMATVIVTLLPILLVYPFLQKYFMQGVMLGSVKG